MRGEGKWKFLTKSFRGGRPDRKKFGGQKTGGKTS